MRTRSHSHRPARALRRSKPNRLALVTTAVALAAAGLLAAHEAGAQAAAEPTAAAQNA